MAKPYAVVNEVQTTLAVAFVHGTDAAATLTSAVGFPAGGGYVRFGVAGAVHWTLYEYTGIATNDLTGLTPCTLGVVESEAAYTFAIGTHVELTNAAEQIEDIRTDRVTAKTGVGTLNVSEFGTILVSAAAAYTLTLPTAVGHTGRGYHVIKTDANYNLITLDGDGTETFNYENSTGAPVTTYPRLNTYCAEVTVVSDGSNWQCINEVNGQMPAAKAHCSLDQLDIPTVTWVIPDFDTEDYDIGSNYDVSVWVGSSATSTAANHLVDSSAPFTAAMVGYRVHNTTDDAYAWITAYNSTTDVTVSADIFASGEDYEIHYSQFVCPIDGAYDVSIAITYKTGTTVADTKYMARTIKNEVLEPFVYSLHSSNNSSIGTPIYYSAHYSANDVITGGLFHSAGVGTVDTYALDCLVIKLAKKD